jgi:hypothetical protein
LEKDIRILSCLRIWHTECQISSLKMWALQNTLFFYSYKHPKKFCFPSLLGIHRNPKYFFFRNPMSRAEWKNWQNGTFEPKHEIQKKFWTKEFFSGIMKVPFTKNIHNIFQGLPNPGFRSVKVQTETFFQKGLTGFKKIFLFRVAMNP